MTQTSSLLYPSHRFCVDAGGGGASELQALEQVSKLMTPSWSTVPGFSGCWGNWSISCLDHQEASLFLAFWLCLVSVFLYPRDSPGFPPSKPFGADFKGLRCCGQGGFPPPLTFPPPLLKGTSKIAEPWACKMLAWLMHKYEIAGVFLTLESP